MNFEIENEIPVQVQACIALLESMGYDHAANVLREQWFYKNKEVA